MFIISAFDACRVCAIIGAASVAAGNDCAVAVLCARATSTFIAAPGSEGVISAGFIAATFHAGARRVAEGSEARLASAVIVGDARHAGEPRAGSGGVGVALTMGRASLTARRAVDALHAGATLRFAQRIVCALRVRGQTLDADAVSRAAEAGARFAIVIVRATGATRGRKVAARGRRAVRLFQALFARVIFGVAARQRVGTIVVGDARYARVTRWMADVRVRRAVAICPAFDAIRRGARRLAITGSDLAAERHKDFGVRAGVCAWRSRLDRRFWQGSEVTVLGVAGEQEERQGTGKIAAHARNRIFAVGYQLTLNIIEGGL